MKTKLNTKFIDILIRFPIIPIIIALSLMYFVTLKKLNVELEVEGFTNKGSIVSAKIVEKPDPVGSFSKRHRCYHQIELESNKRSYRVPTGCEEYATTKVGDSTNVILDWDGRYSAVSFLKNHFYLDIIVLLFQVFIMAFFIVMNRKMKMKVAEA